MEYKVLDKNDIALLEKFIDDSTTQYNAEQIDHFLNAPNSYGFILRSENEVIGFTFGYILLKPNGRKDFYLHAIDIAKSYQGNGYGTKLITFVKDYIKSLNCAKMFLITNKSNTAACRCYEKAGGIATADDDIVYVFK